PQTAGPPLAPVIPPLNPPHAPHRRRRRASRRVTFNDVPLLIDADDRSSFDDRSPFLDPIRLEQTWPSPSFNPMRVAADKPSFFSPTPSAGPAWSHLNPEFCSPRGAFPFLDWDFTRFPSTATRRTSPHSQQTPLSLDSPAVYPPARMLTISYADTPVLQHWEARWGPIFSREQGDYPVTVENVLEAIYQYFNQPLSHADRAALSGPAWRCVSDAYYQRLGCSPHLQAYDVSRGALRLDVLGGATKFSGLELVGRDYLRLMLTR
ncbi:hypothetical protein C8R46DRAFT_1308669, partial [Mycena filopes]